MTKKETKLISFSIDKDLNDKMEKDYINKSGLINDLLKKHFKSKKNK